MNEQLLGQASRKLMLGAFIGRSVTGVKDLVLTEHHSLPLVGQSYLVTGISGVRKGFAVQDFDVVLDSPLDNDSITISAEEFSTHFVLAV